MNSNLHHTPKRQALIALALSIVLSSAHAETPPAAADQQTTRLEEIEVSTSRVSAQTQAPTDSKLDTIQPQSVISLNYIANSVAPTADFATIANIAPGVANVETNGPGLSESKHLTMRGFDDAQYNVTFDGIPFGDINDFSHHTTSYFPAKLIGRVVVDRGPGTAGTIGEATFGGTIAMFSKDPRTGMSFVPTLSYGSWNTQLEHLEFNSGLLPSLNNASAIASYQFMATDGFRTHSDMWRDTTYLKYIQPLGQNATLTFLSSYNKIKFNNPGTVTQATIDTKGRDYGLSADPTATDYFRYNYQEKQADFEYLGFDAKFAGNWSVSDKAYTYYYNNESHEKAKAKVVSGVTDILGRFKVNRYRTYGNYFVLSQDSDIGTFRAGLWIDYSRNPRFLNSLNYTTTGWVNTDLSSTTQWKAVNGNPATLGVDYQMVDFLHTYQPFAEFEWHATNNLTINPGVKYVDFTRDIEAPVNGSSGRQPLYYSHTATKTLPYLAANYRVDGTWSAYAQVAQGFLAPNLNQFYVADPTKNIVKPEQTTNYQIGTVFKTDRFNADADVYYIDMTDYAYSGPLDSSGDPLYWGVAKGATYSGAEIEGTYSLGEGLSAYANGSLISATFKGSKLDVPTVPKRTAALGLVYDRTGFFGSFTEKYVGSWAVYDNISNPDVAGGGAARRADSSSYWIGDLAVGYGLKFDHGFVRSVKLKFQVGNLFDQKVQVLEGIDSSAANAYAKDTFNVLPGRNYFVTLAVEF